ncbi:sigma-54-dependent Fis family transcriptional regulator [Clostridium aminobutyricum]|uniref:Sigma-54-dependent Fis family transcriptional regulator n=1 Tax=Clostridium aminobutyricum TaxID=33953 RepID=A0A939D9C8_CLOAM|nr:sigma-54-dependent Fis family transcriptional regulator [Clostridium aminobutyricum]MBN7773118.1 sigma-54-dependent Fis family transcriptional regulator [Clostridium aminobutyricum]
MSINGIHSQGLRQAWEKFINNQEADDTYIRPEIYESWVRSRAFQVNPYLPKTNLLDSTELNQKINSNLKLIETAHPYMSKLFSIVEGSGFYLLLCDKNGYILDLIGDKEIIEKGRANSMLVVGANRSEQFAGTNAIGTSLALNQPIQIWGEEHYIDAHKGYCCSAAPITDAFGNTIGCLDITGLYAQSHAHTFGMLVSAVDGINKELKILHAYEEIKMISAQRNSIIESIPSGLILLNQGNRVIQINNTALSMFRLQYADIIGKELSGFFSGSHLNFTSLLSSPIDSKEISLYIDGPDSPPLNLNISVDFVIDEQGIRSGTVIRFDEPKRIHTIVNRIGGFKSTYTFEDIKGDSAAMKETLKYAKKAAETDLSVLILGESGTGKELIAQSIHNASSYAKGPFIAINCGSLPKGLIESELFGYEKGSFTGANKDGQPGKFELADGGTIFLDEIGDMPMDVQSSLLRVLQSKEVLRIGGKYPKRIDVRIIAATNKDLLHEIKCKQFREDLYFRLNVFTLKLPPLRYRSEDIILLAETFISIHKNQKGKHYRLSPALYPALLNYSWPGNVRELENVIERAINLSDSEEIMNIQLPEECTLEKEDYTCTPHYTELAKNVFTESLSIESAEHKLIVRGLKEKNGNVEATARALGISRRTLYRKLKKYDIQPHLFKK